MSEHTRGANHGSSIGDQAVDGILVGLLAAIPMALYLLLAGLLAGEGVGGMLGRFDPGGMERPLVGFLTHVAVGGIYGMLFAVGLSFVLRRWQVRLPLWLVGMTYSLVALLLARALFLPVFSSQIQDIPTFHFAVAHIIYGALLGVVLAKRS